MDLKPNKKNYHYVGRYKSPLLYFYVCLPLSSKLSKKYNLPLLDSGLYLDGHCFFNKVQWETIKKQAKKSIKNNNSRFFTSFFKVAQETINDVLLICKKLEQIKNPSINLVNNFFQKINDMEYPWWFSLPLGDALEEVLMEKVKANKISQEDAQSFFILEKPTFLIKQKRDCEKIKKELGKKKLLTKINKLTPKKSLAIIQKNAPDLYQKISRHVKKYKWFGMMHLWGEPFTKEKFIEQLKGGKQAEVGLPKSKKIKLSKELLWLKNISAQVCYWRQLCADSCAVASYTSYAVLGEIGKQKTNFDYNITMWLTPPEFLSMMQGDKIPSLKLLQSRKKGFGFIQKNNQKEIFTGKILQQVLSKMIKVPKNVKEIRGMIANKGYAKGRVKIVLSPDEITKVKKGDIMVSSETTPDFVPAINKASALVTNMGGISSHAAIVSREFNLPCIVGTKIATQVLKDGDFVEVDAVTGVIKKIK